MSIAVDTLADMVKEAKDSGYLRSEWEAALDQVYGKAGSGDFQVGDRVRLTGQTWAAENMAQEVVTIASISTDGPLFWWGGYSWAIFIGGDDDYSATKEA